MIPALANKACAEPRRISSISIKVCLYVLSSKKVDGLVLIYIKTFDSLDSGRKIKRWMAQILKDSRNRQEFDFL